MMIVFLVFMILYHISLNSAMDPLLYYLPRSLEAEEESLLQSGYDRPFGATNVDSTHIHHAGPNEKNFSVSEKPSTLPDAHAESSSVGMIRKFLRPDIYASYAIMRQLVPRDFARISYSPEVEKDAYQHPSVTNVVPLLWIPRDAMGVSRQECAHTNWVTPITDDGATFNEKGKIIWSEEETGGRPPIWEEPIYY